MKEQKLQYLPVGAARYTGELQNYVDFTMRHQLLNAQTWKNFVQVFRADSDIADTGWRCEYWGKMMRGAALTYAYNADEALYTILEETVRDLLSAQRADGRFSTYDKATELNGWDLWGRKYVLTGMLHFYRICKSEDLKAQILCALQKHADAIVATVGEGNGKKPITETSAWWGCVNSCSILEPMLDLYRVTGKEDYLDFARYIIRIGGCKDGNLITLAYENKVMPYLYPEVKAYETMSFFEGVLAYYEVTGEPYYLDAVLRFIEAVAETDITLIGCAGCTHELFDNSAVRQIEYSDIIMQETCVTVTWMRVLARLHLLTGEQKYLQRMERAALNALYGAVNDHMLQQYSREDKLFVDPLPFDSYSPLYNNRRGVGVGGFKRFTFGGYYGCCACIASAGIAVFPLCVALAEKDGVCINIPAAGTINMQTPAGQPLTLTMQSVYPAGVTYTLTVKLSAPESFALRLRIPDYANNPMLAVNGEKIALQAEDGYAVLGREWKDGDTVQLSGSVELKTVQVGSRTAFVYGPLVLARDSAKEEAAVDLTQTLHLICKNGSLCYTLQQPAPGEQIRLQVQTKEGPLLLTDYASCGKNWLQERNLLTVWMNIE